MQKIAFNGCVTITNMIVKHANFGLLQCVDFWCDDETKYARTYPLGLRLVHRDHTHNKHDQ